MPTEDPRDPHASKRKDTDTSLRVERGDIERAIQDLAAIDETMDAAIIEARNRADDVLAMARATTDRHLSEAGQLVAASGALHDARSMADQALSNERAEADQEVADART